MNSNPAQDALILMYHRIADTDMDPWAMCVGRDNFSGQLEAIRSLGTPMNLLDYVRGAARAELPPRPIVLTFDDGYIDNLRVALPLLAHHGVPATIFITTGNIGSEDEFWWDWLETLLLLPPMLPARLALDLPTGPAEWELGAAARHDAESRAADREVPAWRATPGTRLRFFYDVWKRLWPLDPGPRREAMRTIARWTGLDAQPASSRRSMNAAEIGELASSPWIGIGAHTVAHPPLPAHGTDVQAREILDSQRVLRGIVGVPVTSFAYPHGEYSDATIALLHGAGFECAVTVEQKLARPGMDPMKLPRYGVKDVGGEAFLAQFAPLLDTQGDAAA
jgi:peptidoglycan/xylan/chitin deacetylase (PgdA/CDA1 family)